VVAVDCCWPSVVSASVRSMTAHIAHTQRVQGIGQEYGSRSMIGGVGRRRGERGESREKKARVGRSDVTTPPPPQEE